MPTADRPDCVRSLEEYQNLTLELAVGDDIGVDGVVYSRDAWEPDPEDGVRRRTTDTDSGDVGGFALRTENTATEWNGNDLPFRSWLLLDTYRLPAGQPFTAPG